jgi:hypothetical protein
MDTTDEGARERKQGRAERLEQRLASLEDAVNAMREEIATFSDEIGDVVDFTSSALIRGLYLKPEELDYPHRLTAQAFRMWSQFDEDGITLAILREAGTTTKRFVEIGCGANGGNSGFLAAELGWSGLMIDADEQKLAAARQWFTERATVVQAWVTRETIDDVLTEHGMSGEIDVLSIDIDGNDYWIWEALSAVSPRIVIMEANLLFGGERAVVVPYDPDFDRHKLKPSYYGASLAALAALAGRKGYRLVALEPSGPNAFFLRDDVAPHIPLCTPMSVYRQLYKVVRKRLGRGRSGNPVDELYAYIAANDLPLIDVA